ncbi:hypothetical protein F4678DRAFT_465945 [Xylaria arbuscula]|nr:hypothetical protein F4678DRAFT_465945 [Xylaria arbuscula]
MSSRSRGKDNAAYAGILEDTPFLFNELQGALSEFYWKGRDLHSQRRYLALRLRFRGEPYGYMIAHDIHDALKESRKRVYKQEKEAAKQRKKDKTSGRRNTAPELIPESAIQRSTPPPLPPRVQSRSRTQPDLRFQPVSRSRSGGSAPRNNTSKKAANEQGQAVNVNVYVNLNRDTDGAPLIPASDPQDAESSRRKAKKKISKIFTTTPNPEKASSKAVALQPNPEDPFGDPVPEPKRSKSKNKKEKMKKKWKRKGAASIESLGSARDPFRDPEPMRLIEADDFRVESPENTDWPDAPLHKRTHKLGRGRRSKGREDKMRK